MNKIEGSSTGIICGDQNVLLPSHMNYGKVFLDIIVKYKSKPALISGVTEEWISYGDLAQRIVNTTAALIKFGVKRGEVIAVCSENRIEFLITAIAALCSGAVLTFLNYAYSKDEMIHTANISKPKYMFLSPDAYKMHYKNFKSLKFIKEFFIFGKNAASYEANSFEGFADENVDINKFEAADFYGRTQTALILYSSGTTGLPKGAKLTHTSLIVTTHQIKPTLRDLTMLSLAPWCNTMGIMTTSDALTTGKTVVFLTKFTETKYLETLEKYKAGFLVMAPSMLVSLCKSVIIKNYDVNSVVIINTGGSSIDQDNIEVAKKRFSKLLHVLNGYGMTEATGLITRELENEVKKGSVGKITTGIIAKVVDISTGKTLGPNKPGEVCIKGPVLFDGYIGKNLQDDLDEQGFFKTGDIGYYDEEEYFYIVDRLKELIKYNAWQISPSELEAILLQHASVKDAAVVGKPDQAAGELPTAFIVKKPEANVTEKELIEFVGSKVSPWKRLRGGVKFIEEIPKNGSGKILRRLLRETLAKSPISKL